MLDCIEHVLILAFWMHFKLNDYEITISKCKPKHPSLNNLIISLTNIWKKKEKTKTWTNNWTRKTTHVHKKRKQSIYTWFRSWMKAIASLGLLSNRRPCKSIKINLTLHHIWTLNYNFIKIPSRGGLDVNFKQHISNVYVESLYF